MPNPQSPQTYSIMVAGGTGSSTSSVAIGGRGAGFSVKAPTSVAQYDVEFEDADGYLVTGQVGLTGNTKVEGKFQLHSITTIRISNATVNGAYTVRVWFY